MHLIRQSNLGTIHPSLYIWNSETDVNSIVPGWLWYKQSGRVAFECTWNLVAGSLSLTSIHILSISIVYV